MVQGGVVISVTIGEDDLPDFARGDYSINAAVVNGGSTALDLVSTLKRRPAPRFEIVYSDSYDAYLDANSWPQLVPGMRIQASMTLPGPAAGTYPISGGPDGAKVLGASTPGPGIAFSNGASAGVIVGLSGDASGGGAFGPTTAFAVRPGETVQVPRPNAVTVFASRQEVLGAVVDRPKLGGMTLPFSSDGATVAVRFANGKFWRS